MEASPEFERYHNIILSLIQNFRYQQAITNCTRLLPRCKPSEMPDFACQYLYWGHCCSHQGKYQEAISKYARALTLNPDYYEAYIGWGTCLSNMKRYDEAIEKYKEAIKLHPSSPFAALNWILALILQNKEEEAISLAKEKFARTEYRTLDICRVRYRNEIMKIEDRMSEGADADEVKRLNERLDRIKLILQFVDKLKRGK